MGRSAGQSIFIGGLCFRRNAVKKALATIRGVMWKILYTKIFTIVFYLFYQFSLARLGF